MREKSFKSALRIGLWAGDRDKTLLCMRRNENGEG